MEKYIKFFHIGQHNKLNFLSKIDTVYILNISEMKVIKGKKVKNKITYTRTNFGRCSKTPSSI